MADDDKKPAQAAETGDTKISPAPLDAVEKPAEGVPPTPAPTNSRLPAEPLTDGTVPTIINAGESHRSVSKGKTSISKIYRRADVLTTIFTFGGLVVAAIIIGGAYYFLAGQSKNKTVAPTKVTALDQSELTKLGAFFQGDSAGTSGQVLTISSSTLFKNRIATSSDLKVVGGAEISGPTILSDLTVNKNSTLGIVSVNGQLTVAGPASFKSPVILSAGGSVTGNLAVSGTGSFGGALSAGTINVGNITVGGTFSLAGHLSMSGQNPSISPGSESGSGSNTSISGNDAAGTLTINTGTIAGQLTSGGLLAQVTFRTPYARAPTVIISPVGQNAATLRYYVLKTANGFTVGDAGSSQADSQAKSNTQYVFDYWVVQ